MDREVKVDGWACANEVSESGKSEVKIELATLDDYQAGSSDGVWNKFTQLVSELKGNNVSISFFSATPQGQIGYACRAIGVFLVFLLS